MGRLRDVRSICPRWLRRGSRRCGASQHCVSKETPQALIKRWKVCCRHVENFTMRHGFAIGLVLFLIGSPTEAGDWPAWRGPTGDGICAGKGLPTKWDREKNDRWR